MSCHDCSERLSAHLDGELSADEVSEVEKHLGSCAECNRSLEALRAQESELEAAFAPLRARVQAVRPKIAAPARAARFRLLPPLLYAAAGFAAAFAIFFRPPTIDERPIPIVRVPVPVPAPVPVPTPPPAIPVATLAVATGRLEVKKGEDWAPLATGACVDEGAWIRTTDRAKCAFDLSDGSEVRLNVGTEVQLASRRVVLKTGRIYTKVAHDAAQRFSVTTDEGCIQAIGTVLDIARSTATLLTVVEGKALVADKTIDAGYLCKIEKGGVSDPTPAGQLEIATAWVNELLALRGWDGDEFQQRINVILSKIGAAKIDVFRDEEIRQLGDHCAVPLARFIQSTDCRSDSMRRRRAARLLADLATTPSIGDLTRLLSDDDPEIRVLAARGIHRLVGNDGGYEESDWRGPSYAKCAERWRDALGNPRSPWSDKK